MPKNVAARSRLPLGQAGASSDASSSTSHTIGRAHARTDEQVQRAARRVGDDRHAVGQVGQALRVVGYGDAALERAVTTRSPSKASAAKWPLLAVTSARPARRVSGGASCREATTTGARASVPAPAHLF